MKLKSKKYNNYLRTVRQLQGRTTEKSSDSKQMYELGYINRHIKRHYRDGRFVKATFKTFNGFRYEITANAELYKIDKGEKKAIKPHIMSNLGTTYASLRYMVREDGKQHNIPLHLLMMTAAYEEFYDTYKSSKDYRVNHTYIAENDEQRTQDYDAYYNLELVTHSQNLLHGHFIKRYGIYDTHVEAEDIPALESKLIKLDDNMCKELKDTVISMNKRTVNEYYMRKGWHTWVARF